MDRQLIQMLNNVLPNIETISQTAHKVLQEARAGAVEGARLAVETSLGKIEISRLNAPSIAQEDILIFVRGLKRQQEKQREASMNRNVHVHGNVGAVISGDSATVHISQVLEPGEPVALAATLQRVIEHFSSLPESDPAREVVAVAQDAQAELGKERPNMLRLKSALGTVGNAIRTVPALKLSYELLKSTLANHGIHLP